MTDAMSPNRTINSILRSHRTDILEIPSSSSSSADLRPMDRNWKQGRTEKRELYSSRNLVACNQKKQSFSKLLYLPEEILEKMLSYLQYDEISHLRVVCLKFNRCCMRLLNRGFFKVEKYHAHCLKDVKAQLPRRESERRNHCLARHCDILTAIETRLSLLGMTFMKYMDMSLCCFIPGKVLDEIYRVLRYIQTTSTPPRAHEILQELRDISSMAMEHFDEKIAPALKQKISSNSPGLSVTSQGAYTVPVVTPTGYTAGPRPLIRTLSPRQEMTKLNMCIKQMTSVNTALKKELLDYKIKMVEHKKKILEQEKCILEQNRIIAEHSSRLAEQEGKINEVNRKLLEYDRYFADIMTELSRSREDSAAGSTSGCFSSLPCKVRPPLPVAVAGPALHDGEPHKETCDQTEDAVPVVPRPDHGAGHLTDSQVLKGNKSTLDSDGFPAEVSRFRENQDQLQLILTSLVPMDSKDDCSISSDTRGNKHHAVSKDCHSVTAGRTTSKRSAALNLLADAKCSKKRRFRTDVME